MYTAKRRIQSMYSKDQLSEMILHDYEAFNSFRAKSDDEIVDLFKEFNDYKLFVGKKLKELDTYEKMERNVEKAVETMRNKNLLYDQDGAIFFKSSEYGDEKDRVLKKSDGLYTYMTPDVANHANKYDRGYET